jgi:hypothetical protein
VKSAPAAQDMGSVQIRSAHCVRLALSSLALLAPLSCFALRLKAHKTGNILKIFFAKKSDC